MGGRSYITGIYFQFFTVVTLSLNLRYSKERESAERDCLPFKSFILLHSFYSFEVLMRPALHVYKFTFSKKLVVVDSSQLIISTC
jgi:hypothetical protein